MTGKPLTYRGVTYTIARGPSLNLTSPLVSRSGVYCGGVYAGTVWHGIIVLDGVPVAICEASLKGDAERMVKAAIWPAYRPPVDLSKLRPETRARIRKLRRMTVRNGCTFDEADTAAQIVRKLANGGRL